MLFPKRTVIFLVDQFRRLTEAKEAKGIDRRYAADILPSLCEHFIILL
jgi:hypothetical protein